MRFNVVFEEKPKFSVSFGEVVEHEVPSEIETYVGDYEVNPKFEETVLETKNKRMDDNVTVLPIEVSRVSNLQNGKTVYIGGIING